MNVEPKDALTEFEPNEISETELETIIAGIDVRSGIKAGPSPCL